MAFNPFETAREAEILPGDTLETIAEREQEQGNDVTAEDIARFNWGTDDPEHIQELLRDRLGATRRSAPHAFVLAPEDTADEPLRIPEPFRAEALAPNAPHRFFLRRKSCPNQFLSCTGLPTLSFEFDSSFLRPEAKEHLKRVAQMAEAFPDSKLFIFGHTDAVGTDIYNKKLSERRAWAVHTFLTKDPEAWETLYSHHAENWGVKSIQAILAHLGHDPGPEDGALGPLTHGAMRSFLGLPDDAPVKNDAAFRLQLFEANMSGPDDPQVPADRFCGDGFMGCGEFNLAEVTDSRSPENRRVTIFAFHQDRLPNIPCAFADLGPCRARIDDGGPRYNAGFSCSFYDTLAEPCAAENEHHRFSLLIRKFPVTSDVANRLIDEFELRSECGKLGLAQNAMSAGTLDDTYLVLNWEHIREHMVLSLVQKFGDRERMIFSRVPYAQLHEEGHIGDEDEAPFPMAPKPEADEAAPEEEASDADTSDQEETEASAGVEPEAEASADLEPEASSSAAGLPDTTVLGAELESELWDG